MRHRVHTFKIGRSSAHRRAMLANMVSSLFTTGQIQTTLVKAKEARRFAEKLITIGKKGDLHRRRIAAAKLRNKSAVKLLFDQIAPSYEGRNGGYTRILKLGVRRGDAAEMCILQLLQKTEEKNGKTEKKETAEEKPNPVTGKTKSEEPAKGIVETAESKPEEKAEAGGDAAEAQKNE